MDNFIRKNNNKQIVSLSGGKDSSAMLLRMIELKYPIDIIAFADTTLEFPEMYEWINFLEKKIGQKINRYKPKYTINEWLRGNYVKGKNKGRKRGLPYHFGKFCHLRGTFKVNQISKIQKKGTSTYIGFAKNEKHRSLSKSYKNKNKFKFPLLDWEWCEQDCINYLKEKKVPFPFFDKKRTGCWLCPQQNLDSLKILCLKYPELWNRLLKYEEDSPQGFKPNFSLREFQKKCFGE